MRRVATRVSTYLSALVLLLMLPVDAVFAYGQINVTHCGTTINAPGQYILVNDLNCSGDGISIRDTNDVELSLGGHRITGTSSGRGIVVVGAKASRVLGPGTVENFSTGVWLSSDTDVVVAGVTSMGATSDGFLIVVSSAVLRGNTALNSGYGFDVGSFDRCELSGNTANGNARGFVVLSTNTTIHDNTAFNNRLDGIATDKGATANHIAFNAALGNGALFHCCDLNEGNPTCRNSWEHNMFDTTNKSECVH